MNVSLKNGISEKAVPFELSSNCAFPTSGNNKIQATKYFTMQKKEIQGFEISKVSQIVRIAMFIKFSFKITATKTTEILIFGIHLFSPSPGSAIEVQ